MHWERCCFLPAGEGHVTGPWRTVQELDCSDADGYLAQAMVRAWEMA